MDPGTPVDVIIKGHVTGKMVGAVLLKTVHHRLPEGIRLVIDVPAVVKLRQLAIKFGTRQQIGIQGGPGGILGDKTGVQVGGLLRQRRDLLPKGGIRLGGHGAGCSIPVDRTILLPHPGGRYPSGRPV